MRKIVHDGVLCRAHPRESTDDVYGQNPLRYIGIEVTRVVIVADRDEARDLECGAHLSLDRV